jgi:hypothetical protein
VPKAQAGCVIAPDGKSINVVTDNGSSDEKTCSVSCKVDTKIGVVQLSCGGTTLPFAKAYSLCNYDKPESWYKKVISSEDSCKGGSAPALVPVSAPPVKPVAFACRISPDGKSVDAVIVNPYKSETNCQIDCQLSTTKAGITFSMSGGRPAAPGVEAVLSQHRQRQDGKGDRRPWRMHQTARPGRRRCCKREQRCRGATALESAEPKPSAASRPTRKS